MITESRFVSSGIYFHCLLVLLFSPLTLRAQGKPYRGAEYRTKASYQYGRFEVRMKSAPGNGMLTSFFTYHDPTPFSAANWNEIDIEILGRYSNEVQYNTITPGRIDHVHRQVVKFNPHLAFHVHAFEWTPDYVAWFVDGHEVHRQTASHVSTLSRAQKIMMNIWQPNSVSWVGLFDPAGLPYHGFYDWVKYYAYTPGVGDNFTLQWTDNFDNWDQSRWDKATHTFDGNNAQFIQDNAVFRNGYLILCLTSPAATGYRGGAIVDLDLEPPYLVWARAEEQRLTVFFSEELEQTSAEMVSNYTVPGVTIRSAQLQPGNKSVTLLTDSLDLSKNYVLVVTGIKDRSPSNWQMGLQYTNVVNALPFPIKINVAGQAEAGFLPDQTWDSYKEYGAVGGTVKTRPSGTSLPAIYQTEREALTFYQVRVPAGRYRLTLMMADTDHDRAGQRVFDVCAEGQLLFDNLDIVAEVGKSTALEKVVSDFAVTDGRLDLYFKPEIGAATLSGLQIERLGTSGIKYHHPLPAHFELGIHPNPYGRLPFNPSTNVVYTLGKSGRVKLVLFDALGQLVRNLFEAPQPEGTHTYVLETNQLSTGVYFISMLFDGQLVTTTKLLCLK
ncbi:MAG: family 16 glycosylhydrolase [candidate division KSB1 bacterium]|nr:family 16 glycosylhydrolase [candidate division KSB1 bacterium]MDZ7301874.1 family 16 glycosylhydrolase [candidate division KSB1 bacterium]MDZ7310257.1 family 16 glycosylhydrolase [candidate division KSB1 bacterium]